MSTLANKLLFPPKQKHPRLEKRRRKGKTKKINLFYLDLLTSIELYASK
jgi:hypothetical protein